MSSPDSMPLSPAYSPRPTGSVLATGDRLKPSESPALTGRGDALVTGIDTPSWGDAATQTGSVLGTPACMPPEQTGRDSQARCQKRRG